MKKYDEQARFLAQKLKEATLLELTRAELRGELQYIKKEQIKDIAEIVYYYFAEYERPYGGGSLRADINFVIEKALSAYRNIRSDEARLVLLENEIGEFIKETRENFAQKTSNINIELDGCNLEDINGYSNYHEFVKDPTYQFSYLGNSGAFTMEYENEQGLPIRIQYFDGNGDILEEPIVTNYINHRWQPEITIKQR